MSDRLIFKMGEYEAVFPTDRSYCRNHMWALALPDELTYRFGLTAYAVRLLQEVFFLDWYASPGDRVVQGQEIGAIESSKAESSLYAPLTGEVIRFNEALLEDPSLINLDAYSRGWMFELRVETPPPMAPVQYIEYLKEVWPKTQRLIKGQL